MKKGPSPKFSLLVQIGEEIWAPVCSDDSKQILLKIGSDLNFNDGDIGP